MKLFSANVSSWTKYLAMPVTTADREAELSSFAVSHLYQRSQPESILGQIIKCNSVVKAQTRFHFVSARSGQASLVNHLELGVLKPAARARAQ